MTSVVSSFFDALGERIRSPILGSVALVFVSCNWKSLFYLFFAEQAVSVRLRFFELNTDWVSLFWLPLGIGIILAFIAPLLTLLGAFAARWANRELAILQEEQASLKRIRGYEFEAKELNAATDKKVAEVNQQRKIQEAEENLKIEAQERLEKAGEIVTKREADEQLKAESATLLTQGTII
jgi:hypothetical protein